MDELLLVDNSMPCKMCRTNDIQTVINSIILLRIFVCFVAMQTLVYYMASTDVKTILFRERTSYPSGERICSSDAPSQIQHGVRSKGACSLWCLQESRCSAVNWRQTNTCEMFFFHTYRFIKVLGCVHLFKGEKTVFLNTLTRVFVVHAILSGPTGQDNAKSKFTLY